MKRVGLATLLLLAVHIAAAGEWALASRAATDVVIARAGGLVVDGVVTDSGGANVRLTCQSVQIQLVLKGQLQPATSLTVIHEGHNTPAPASASLLPDIRNRWRDEKGMMVFSMIDPARPFFAVDIFVEEAIPFNDLLLRSVVVETEDGPIRVCSYEDLIELKSQAGRPQDLADIHELQAISAARRTEP